MLFEYLKTLLLMSWDKETCSPSLKDEWGEDNPYIGQCAITALIVNDFYGGKIMRCMSSTGSHYYNLIDGRIVDLTVSQFLGEIPDYVNGEERTREYLLENNDTRNRYNMLRYNLKQSIRQAQGKKFRLLNSFGEEILSDVPGKFGGNRRLKIYGRLDCPSAKRWIGKGMYVSNRVFFLDEETAISAGYRPCAICMKNEYEEWKNKQFMRTLK